MSNIAGDVAIELLRPVVGPRLRSSRGRATRVLMPEASMNEQHDAPARKHKVWHAWQSPVMQSVSKAGGMKEAANGQLRASVL